MITLKEVDLYEASTIIKLFKKQGYEVDISKTTVIYKDTNGCSYEEIKCDVDIYKKEM